MPTTPRRRGTTQPPWLTAARSLFQCPACAGPLDIGAKHQLACQACGKPVATTDGILDFVAGAATTSLDNIDYDEFYSIDAEHSQSLHQGLQRAAGKRWPKSFGTALEIGCGTGGLSQALYGQVRTDAAVLTDISPKMLRICRNRLNQAMAGKAFIYATFSGTESCFAPNSFDSCFGTAVVHHILDVPAFLRHVHDLLKPTGFAFFMEPSRPFHKALTATLADIVVHFRRHDLVPEQDTVLMLSWISEVHCNIANSGDIEVLAQREDKHYFLAHEFLSSADDAGFHKADALPTDLDPTGAQTIQVYMHQMQISPEATQALAKAWPAHQQRHFGSLAVSDRSPSYLFWMRKNTRARSAGRPAAARPVPRRLPTEAYLHVERRQAQIAVHGWCVSDIAAASLQISIGIARHRLPIYIRRPDIQQAINRDGRYPAVCALCSGIEGALDLPEAFGNQTDLNLTFQIILSDRTVLDAGDMTLRLGDTKTHHKSIPP